MYNKDVNVVPYYETNELICLCLRYQAIQITSELMNRLSLDKVELIVRYLESVGMSRRVMEMIMLALSRETERTVDCALQVVLCACR